METREVSVELLDAGLRLIEATTERLNRQSISGNWELSYHISHLTLQALQQSLAGIKAKSNAID